MSKFELNRKREIDIKSIQCYNCGTEISNKDQKYCLNCYVILDPNKYIKWRNSFYGFLCLICIIPILIAILISFFYI
ncbi:MAG: hypothetical protein ACFFAN_16245 [Promethearchaeota archaeon]